MTAAHLRPCPGCSRHVRVTEGACPFCGVLLEPAFRAAPAPIPPSRRLSRAALFAFGAGAVVLTPAVAVDCVSDGYVATPPYGHGPGLSGDGGEESQDSSYMLADVRVGSADAGDSSAQDTGSSVNAGSGSESDGAASDAPSDAQDAD